MFRPLLIILIPLKLYAGTIDLDDAIALAFEGNRALLNARYQTDTAAVRLAIEGNDFHLSGGPALRAEQRSSGERVDGGLEVRKQHATGFEWQAGAGIEFNNDSGAYARVRMSQPLFRRAGREVNLEGVRSADDALRNARRRYYERKQDLMIEVISAYERVRRAHRQIESDQAALARLENLFRLSSAREEIGQGSRVETLRSELQKGEAHVRLQNSEEALATAEDEFRRLLGKPMQWNFGLVPVPKLEMIPPSEPDAFALALSNRLDLAMALDAISTAGRRLNLARKDRLPDVRVRADVYGREQQDWEEDWFVGLSVTPDLSGNEKELLVENADTGLRIAEMDADEIEYRVQQDVRARVRDYHRSQTRHRISIRNNQLAWERVRLAAALFELEKADQEAVTDAEEAYATATVALLNSQADATLSGYRVMRSLGTLLEVPDELKP